MYIHNTITNPIPIRIHNPFIQKNYKILRKKYLVKNPSNIENVISSKKK